MQMSEFKSKLAICLPLTATNPAKTSNLKAKTSSLRSSSRTTIQSSAQLVKVPHLRKSSCATAGLQDTISIGYRRNKFCKCGWLSLPFSEFEKMTDQLNLTDAQKTMCKEVQPLIQSKKQTFKNLIDNLIENKRQFLQELQQLDALVEKLRSILTPDQVVRYLI